MLDLAAAGALEVAREQRLELDDQRELLAPQQLLLQQVRADPHVCRSGMLTSSTSPGWVTVDVDGCGLPLAGVGFALASGPGGRAASRAPEGAQRGGPCGRVPMDEQGRAGVSTTARTTAARRPVAARARADSRSTASAPRAAESARAAPVTIASARAPARDARSARAIRSTVASSAAPAGALPSPPRSPAGPTGAAAAPPAGTTVRRPRRRQATGQRRDGGRRPGPRPRRRRGGGEVGRSAARRRTAPGRPSAVDGSSRSGSVGDDEVAGCATGAAAPPTPAQRHRPAGAAGRSPIRVPPTPSARCGAARRSVTGVAAAYRPERGDREDQPVQVVVDVEVAGEAGAGELRLVPGPVGPLRADQQLDAAPAAPVALPGREQREQRPGRLRRGRRAAADPRRVAVGAQVLAPAAVGVLLRLQPARPPAGSRPVRRGPRPRPAPARGAGAVDVVGAPAAEPGAVGLLVPQQPVDAAVASGTPRRPACGEHLDHVRGDVGGRRVDDRAEVAERQLAASSRVLSASNAPQPPSCDCIPTTQPTPRSAAASAASGRRRRRGAGRARPRRCRRRPGSCRSRTRTPSRRAPAPAGAPTSRRRHRISSPSSQSAAAAHGRVDGRHARRRAARSARARCPRPATGRPRAGAPARAAVRLDGS